LPELRVLRIQSRICIGGPALNSILLSAYLDPQHYSTLLVGGRLEPGEQSMAPLAEEKGVRIQLIPEMGRSVRWLDDLRALIKLIGLIRRYRPHIVHTHTAKAGALGRVAAWLCRVPIRIHTFHGHVFEGYFGAMGNWAARMVERMLAALSTRVIAISASQRHDLVQRFGVVPAEKAVVIRLGFEMAWLGQGRPGRFKEQVGLPPSCRVAGILARLVPIKNHALLLHAIAGWVDGPGTRTPDQVRFLVMGDGELRSELERLARDLGIESWVEFTGWRRDLADIYEDLDLNILVSRNEGTPVTLIEGLCAGVPVLTTDVGGIRDFLPADAGVILRDPTVEDLAEQLRRWTEHPPRFSRLDEATREQVRAAFHVDRLVADMDRLYRSLAKAKGLI